MAVSNYPKGFAGGVLIRGIPLQQANPGKVFWVGASTEQGVKGVHDGDNNGTFFTPFSTIDYAIGRCAASRGDIIFVRPGHTETVAAAAGLALDVAGVSVVGLGAGANRPTVNLTATTSTVTMSAANCAFSNILFTGGVDAIVSMIVVSAADCAIESCEMRDVTGEMVLGILTTAAADRLYIQDYFHNGAAAAGTNAAIRVVGGDGIVIQNFRMDGNFAVGGIDIGTTATTDILVKDCHQFRTRNAADIFIIDTITASTGQIGPWLNLRLQDNAANITEACTGATFVYVQPINVVNLAGESSMFTNITASTDA